jgi:hypothetical protein
MKGTFARSKRLSGARRTWVKNHTTRARSISRAFSPWAKKGNHRHFLKVW